MRPLHLLLPLSLVLAAFAAAEMTRAGPQDAPPPAAVSAAPAISAAPARAVPESKAQMLLSFAPLVKRTAPAVVNIYTTRKRAVPTGDPLLGFFFGRGGFTEREEQSLGSGVLISPDGLIVTCRHVISDSDSIKVVLADKREFDAKVTLQDSKTDLAMLRIQAPQPLPFLELMQSDDLETGDLVLAIGNPFGVGQTVTSGIVSALARTTVGATDYRFFIQTDASINPGNSGGALVNMEGKLAGINTSIFSPSGGSNGVGFAVPADMVKVVARTATGAKGAGRPWIGLRTQDVTREIAESLSLSRTGGALVTGVFPGGPADAAGVRPGDVILSMGEHEVQDQHALQFRIATQDPGRPVTLNLWREGKPLAANVTLTPPPEAPPRRRIRPDGPGNPFAGGSYVNISPAVLEELGLDFDQDGVAVESVSGLAEQAGLHKGDVILEVNGSEITATDQLMDLINASRAGRWEAVIQRGDKMLTLSWLL